MDFSCYILTGIKDTGVRRWQKKIQKTTTGTGTLPELLLPIFLNGLQLCSSAKETEPTATG